jgi:hypothetical protein
MSSSKRNFQNTKNETVKTTYVPNTIRVPTHGVDLMHHDLPIGERTPKSPMELPQCEERKMKKERDEGKRERKKREREACALFCIEVTPTWQD